MYYCWGHVRTKLQPNIKVQYQHCERLLLWKFHFPAKLQGKMCCLLFYLLFFSYCLSVTHYILLLKIIKMSNFLLWSRRKLSLRQHRLTVTVTWLIRSLILLVTKKVVARVMMLSYQVQRYGSTLASSNMIWNVHRSLLFSHLPPRHKTFINALCWGVISCACEANRLVTFQHSVSVWNTWFGFWLDYYFFFMIKKKNMKIYSASCRLSTTRIQVEIPLFFTDGKLYCIL